MQYIESLALDHQESDLETEADDEAHDVGQGFKHLQRNIVALERRLDEEQRRSRSSVAAAKCSQSFTTKRNKGAMLEIEDESKLLRRTLLRMYDPGSTFLFCELQSVGQSLSRKDFLSLHD